MKANIKKLTTMLLALMLLLCALPAMASAWQAGSLTVDVPDDWRVSPSSSDGHNFLSIYPKGRFYHISNTSRLQGDYSLTQIYNEVQKGFLSADPNAVIHVQKTMYLGDVEARFVRTGMNINGQSVELILFIVYDGGELYNFALTTTDGTAISLDDLQALFSVIQSPAIFRQTLTYEGGETVFGVAAAGGEDAAAGEASALDEAPAGVEGLGLGEIPAVEEPAAPVGNSSQGLIFSAVPADGGEEAAAEEALALDEAPAGVEGLGLEEIPAVEETAVDESAPPVGNSSQGLIFSAVPADGGEDAAAEEAPALDEAPAEGRTMFGPFGFVLKAGDEYSISDRVENESFVNYFPAYDDAAQFHPNINIIWFSDEAEITALLALDADRMATSGQGFAESAVSALSAKGIPCELLSVEPLRTVTIDGHVFLKLQYKVSVDYTAMGGEGISESVTAQYFTVIPGEGSYVITVTAASDEDAAALNAMVEGITVEK